MSNYIDNKKFNDLLIDYRKTKNEKTYNEIGKMFIKLANNIMRKPNFSNYTNDRKNDMVSDAIYHMVKYMGSYDVERGNPFAFFSQITFNAFIQNINKRKKEDNTFLSLDYIDNMNRGKDEQ